MFGNTFFCLKCSKVNAVQLFVSLLINFYCMYSHVKLIEKEAHEKRAVGVISLTLAKI